jgi:hypothetical protein
VAGRGTASSRPGGGNLLAGSDVWPPLLIAKAERKQIFLVFAFCWAGGVGRYVFLFLYEGAEICMEIILQSGWDGLLSSPTIS